jgi:predicted dehydrogenase
VLFKSIGRDHQSPPQAAAQTELNGTLFHDSSTHDFDLARWLVGDEITEVHAYTGSLAIPDMERFGGFDAGVVNLQFASGAIGNVESYMDARYGYDVRTEIVGTLGTLLVGDTRSKPLTVLAPEARKEGMITHWLERFAEAYRLEMADFVNSVLSDRPVSVNGRDGWQSLAIADAATRSQRERRPIAVPTAVPVVVV